MEALYQKYKAQGVQVLVIDVKESKATTTAWVKRMKYTFPVLLDSDGKIATRYAPAGAQPDLPKDQVPIASNLVLDRSGKIRFFSLLDTANFDAKLLALTVRLDALLTEK